MNTRHFAFILLCAAVVFSGCATMVRYSAGVPELKATQDKALVVVARPAPKAGAAYSVDKISSLFVDGVFGTVTTDLTVSEVAVDTGAHYIMARIDNIATVKLNFLAGKVYYLVQKVTTHRSTAPSTPGGGTVLAGGLTRVQTTLEPVTRDEFSALLKSSGNGFRFAKFAQSKPLKNMEPHAKKAHITAYEYWTKAKPDLARLHFDYPGY